MKIAIEKLFAQLMFWLMDFLDALMGIFKKLCGIDNVTVGTGAEAVEKSIVDVFLDSKPVEDAFLGVFGISILVMAVSVIVSVVKSIIRGGQNGERKSHAKTVGQGIGSIVTSLVMAIVMVLGISVSNKVLFELNIATNAKSEVPISQQIFEICITPEVELDKTKPIYGYIYNEYGEQIPELDEDGKQQWVVLDKTGMPLMLKDKTQKAHKTEEAAEAYRPDTSYNVSVLYKTERVGYEPKEGGELKLFYSDRPNAEEAFRNFDFGKWGAVDDMFGVRHKSFFVFENEDKAYKSPPIVQLGNFNMFMCYLTVIMMLVALVWSMLSLVKRLFDLVFLFLILPLISATIPLDDGARFKAWRETVVSKVVLAYGAILSVNVYLLMLPIIIKLSVGEALLTGIFRVFLLMGGALAVNGGQLLLSRLMGTSAEEGREMAQSARALLGGAATAIGGLGMVKRAALGGTNKYGRQTKGALGLAGRIGAKGVNAVGNTLYGDAYRRKAASVVNGANSVFGKAGSLFSIDDPSKRRHDGFGANARTGAFGQRGDDGKIEARQTGNKGLVNKVSNAYSKIVGGGLIRGKKLDGSEMGNAMKKKK